MRLTLGISSCPNDTFIFDALIHQKVDTEGLEFDVVFADVEKLNKLAFEEKLDVTKLSFNAFAQCISKYILLDSGSALGRKCGPILIKRPNVFLSSNSKIAIPGKYTTANLLLSISNSQYLNKVEMCFSEIENAILSANVEAGLIIHENRFTYEQKGLEKVEDLGEFWEEETGLPLPLGGIVVKRLLSYEIQKKMERVLKKSIEYAFLNRDASLEFVKYHANEIEIDVINSHIALYVNNYSISLGEKGRKAVTLLFDRVGCKHDNIFL